MDQRKKKALIEIALYIFFGVLTSVVSFATYFIVLWMGEAVFKMNPNDGSFYVIRITAQILQWVFAVLFAFYTNRKWVFTSADKTVSVWKQLITFSSSRLLTLFFDTGITLGTVALLQAVSYSAVEINFIIRIPLTADVISKLIASAVVIILNYVFSKLLVFRTKKSDPQDGEPPLSTDGE